MLWVQMAASVLSAPTYDVVTGTIFSETINGTADGDVIYGGSQGATTSTGSDTINAGDGNDIIYGGDGDDTVVIQGNLNSNDTFYGGIGSDTMVLSPDDDRDLTIDMSTNSVSDGLGGGQYFYDVENITTAGGDDTVLGDANDNTIITNAGNDTVNSGAGNDTVIGGHGDDTITTGSGDDTVYGNSGEIPTGTTEHVSWNNDGTLAQFSDLSGGFTQNTGTMNVTFTQVNDGAMGVTQNYNGTHYTEAGDPWSSTSSLYVTGTGGADVSTSTLTFNPVDATAIEDEVSNVSFRINDIDQSAGGWRDQLIVRAYDADGNEVPVVITAAGNDVVANGNVTAGDGSDSHTGFNGSVLFEIPGPVHEITIDYNNAGDPAGQFVLVSDVYFDTIPVNTGSDSITTGAGEDLIYGEEGDDNIDGGADNDTIFGGAGNDTITGSLGSDSISSGEGDDYIQGDATTDTTYTVTSSSLLATNPAARVDDDATLAVAFTNPTEISLDFSSMENNEENLIYIDGELVDLQTLIDNGLVTLTGGLAVGPNGGVIGTTNPGTSSSGTLTFNYPVSEISIDHSGGGWDYVTVNYETDGSYTAITDYTNGATGTFANDTSGDGDDVIISGDGADTMFGGEGNETNGDTLQLGTLGDFTILNFSEIENIICFTPDTQIVTPQGSRPVQDLRPGDLVVKRDHGLQPIRWIKSRTVPALDRFAPIRIKQGVLSGQQEDILVSPQHRMLFTGYQSELLFGDSEVLVSAKHLVDGRDVTIETGGFVTYYHILFDEHEIIYANGAASESFHPSEIGLSAVTDEARDELFALFPELRSLPSSYGATARRCLKKHEAGLL